MLEKFLEEIALLNDADKPVEDEVSRALEKRIRKSALSGHTKTVLSEACAELTHGTSDSIKPVVDFIYGYYFENGLLPMWVHATSEVWTAIRLVESNMTGGAIRGAEIALYAVISHMCET